MDKKELDDLFVSKKMSEDALTSCTAIRMLADELATAIYHYVPDSREKSLAFTKLEESIMWANKGLSRHG